MANINKIRKFKEVIMNKKCWWITGLVGLMIPVIALTACKVSVPGGIGDGSPIQVVDRVHWFEIAQDGLTTWYAVDRPVYLALTLPPGSGPTAIQQLSEVIDRVVPARPVDPSRS